MCKSAHASAAQLSPLPGALLRAAPVGAGRVLVHGVGPRGPRHAGGPACRGRAGARARAARAGAATGGRGRQPPGLQVLCWPPSVRCTASRLPCACQPGRFQRQGLPACSYVIAARHNAFPLECGKES